ncbi:hypothetical protein BTUL_0248g00020 [Botrytis tulipae]|uniref:Uncharacterized protein n=1 Tax=Botrytis tulipae TaxID=87230 RepID=A0A4Z1E938_9HELO|nr:hypothetical protein BTUL_0248g00020 [Botrytis tulipae]
MSISAGTNASSLSTSNKALTKISTGVMVIFVKLSDLLTKKSVFTTSIVIFTVFPGSCGAAKKMRQLTSPKPEPYEVNHTTVKLFAIPGRFPYYTAAELSNKLRIFGTNPNGTPSTTHASKGTPKKLDTIGTILVLLATVIMAAGFQEIGSRFPWKSCTMAVACSIGAKDYAPQWSSGARVTLRFLTTEVMIGILLYQLFLPDWRSISSDVISNAPDVPISHGLSGLDVGIRVVPFTALWAFGLLVSPTLASKLKVPPIYIVLAGSCIQTIGFPFGGALPFTLQIPSRIYAYEVIAGLGCDLVFLSLFIMIPFVAKTRDRAVGMATGSKFQVIGSTIVL